MMEDTIVGDEDVHVDERYIFGILCANTVFNSV